MTKIKTHGVTQQHVNHSPQDYYLEQLKRVGFVILPDVFTPDEVSILRQRLLEIYAEQSDDFGGEDNLLKIKDRNICRSMLVWDEIFLETVINPVIYNLVKAYLGENISLSSQVGVLNRPDQENYQIAWHRELQYQHFVSTSPLAVQSMIALDPFNASTGGTFVLPGSHLFNEFPSDEFANDFELQVTMEPGSAVIFDSMLFHRAGVNTSQADRLGIVNLYTQPFIAQQIAFSRQLDGKYSDNSELYKLLGYRWSPADSVLQWRKDHLNK